MRGSFPGPATAARSHEPRYRVSKVSWRCALLLLLVVAPCMAMSEQSTGIAPARASVYAHRGASALLPEHTLAAYAQAIQNMNVMMGLGETTGIDQAPLFP